MKRALGISLFGVVLAGSVAWAQNRVVSDQGRPGTQGPWPVTLKGTPTTPDGGYFVMVAPVMCAGVFSDAGVPHKVTSVGTTATAVPATSTPARHFIEVCNSLENSGTPLVKCRSDGTAPIMGIATAGEVLGAGDCRVYTTSAPLSCISDTAATAVHTYECM